MPDFGAIFCGSAWCSVPSLPRRQPVPGGDRDFDDARQGIVERESREGQRFPQRLEIAAGRQRAALDLAVAGDDVVTGMHPADAGTAGARCDGLADGLAPGQIGEIDASKRAEPAPGPEAPVDVQQFVLAIARVMFEFEFDDAGIGERLQEPPGQFGDPRLVDALDEGAGAAEIDWQLPGPPRDQRRDRLAAVPQAGIGELRGAGAGHPLLHDDGVVADQGRGALIQRQQCRRDRPPSRLWPA